MVWFNSIFDLQYYNPLPGGLPCYCEQLINPTDLYLQGLVYNAAAGSATLKIYTYSANGVTQYADDTNKFNWFFGVAPNGQQYFTAQLKSFSTSMCTHSCFILRVVLTQNGTTLFDKYTERYCNTNCCEVPTDITSSQSDIIISNPDTNPIASLSPQSPVYPANSCGERLISLITKFNCYDNFGGNIYTSPATIYASSGSTNFAYQKISTFRGRIVRRPKELKREISYNCKLQETESANQYLFEGQELFPTWKMAEIENQFHADSIVINDYSNSSSYQFAGGTIFEQPSKCFELFKLRATVQDCTIRQYSGCNVDCSATNNYFIIPDAYIASSGSFYSEGGQLIASSYNDGDGFDLLTWVRSQPNVTNAEAIDVSSFDCSMYGLLAIEGTGINLTSIYFGSPTGRNKLYALQLQDVTNICGYTGITPCPVPTIDTVIVRNVNCPTPVNGTVIVEDAADTAVSIMGYNNWVISSGESSVSVYANQVTFSIFVRNVLDYTGVSDSDISLSNVIVGVIGASARPVNSIVLDNSNNPLMPIDTYLTIQPNGQILFSGQLIFMTDNELIVNFMNLVYNI